MNAKGTYIIITFRAIVKDYRKLKESLFLVKYEFDESEGIESMKDISREEDIEVRKVFINRAKSFAIRPQ